MTYTRCTMSHYIALLSAIGRAVMSKYLPNHAALSSPRNRIAIATAIAELRRTRADWCWDDRHTEQSRIAEHLWKMTADALDLDVDEAVVCANPACPTPTAYAARLRRLHDGRCAGLRLEAVSDRCVSIRQIV